jgi:hypothetical protein
MIDNSFTFVIILIMDECMEKVKSNIGTNVQT